LKLIFDHCTKITQEGFFYIQRALPKLGHLEALELKFQECTQIGEHALEPFKYLDPLHESKIREVIFDFSQCQITSAAMSKLSQSLMQFDHLRNLKLSFCKSTQILDETVRAFVTKFKPLRELLKVNYIFEGCTSLSDQ